MGNERHEEVKIQTVELSGRLLEPGDRFTSSIDGGLGYESMTVVSVDWQTNTMDIIPTSEYTDFIEMKKLKKEIEEQKKLQKQYGLMNQLKNLL